MHWNTHTDILSEFMSISSKYIPLQIVGMAPC